MPTKAPVKLKKSLQKLRGMKDILPEDQKYWIYIRNKVEEIANVYSYGRIDMPILEDTSLFVRSVGKETDIVEKEMYTFEDRGGDSISLRPEGTAGVVRAYIEHGMLNRPQPVKLFYYGPFFRYDRPQAGRYRQFHQFGFEVIGENHPVVDAQLMMMSFNLYKELGLPVSLQVNSIGSVESREVYRKALLDYYRSRKNSLCEDCKKRMTKNTLRLLDCKEEDCKLLSQDAPQIIDYLDEDSNQHFVKVLEHLDSMEVPYVLNSRLVRGLDYYSGTVFEIWPDNTVEIEKTEEKNELVKTEEKKDDKKEEENIESDHEDKKAKPGSQSALGGGGRYNQLVEALGGQETPAMGFACGVERLVIELKNRDIKVPGEQKPDLFVAQLGDEARKKSLKLFEDLRLLGFKIAENFSKDGLKNQMEQANKKYAKYTIIIGQKEILDGTILIRDMENGIQETVDFDKIIPELQKRLEKYGVKEKNEKKEKKL
ncbi:MAG: histidine--tRNA ligase [Candidatus Kerfeldbacteria bacterium]